MDVQYLTLNGYILLSFVDFSNNLRDTLYSVLFFFFEHWYLYYNEKFTDVYYYKFNG